MKKWISFLCILSLAGAGAVYAEESPQPVVSPDSELYETVRIMEEQEVELTEDSAEKIIIKVDQGEKRLAEAERMLEEGDEDAASQLVEEYTEHVGEVEEELEESDEIKEEDLATIQALIVEKWEKRSKNLMAMLEREDLPETAKAGMMKALANKQRALQHFAEAKLKKIGAEDQAEAIVRIIVEGGQNDEAGGDTGEPLNPAPEPTNEDPHQTQM
jgi:hypothetical protein